MRFTATLLAALFTFSSTVPVHSASVNNSSFPSTVSEEENSSDWDLLDDTPLTGHKRPRAAYTAASALKDLIMECPANLAIDWTKLSSTTELNLKSVLPAATELVILRMGICLKTRARPVAVQVIASHEPGLLLASSLDSLFAADGLGEEFVDGLPRDLFVSVDYKIVNTSLAANETITFRGSEGERRFQLKAAIKELPSSREKAVKYATYLRNGKTDWILRDEDGELAVKREMNDGSASSVLFYFQERGDLE